MKKLFDKAISLILLFVSINAWALTQEEKLWIAINAKQTLSNDKKWVSFIYSQLRIINESHPLQSGIVEGGVGYKYVSDNTIWIGYRWTGHNPYNGFYQENRLFQQLIQQSTLPSSDLIISRTRLEELERADSNQISVRLRQRISIEFIHQFLIKATPVIYDEIFFQLNNTEYTSNKLVTENRIFLGYNFYTSKETWWEIGYINQFQLRTPQRTENTLSHIFSITYNFS